jgi:hypothetical protein
MTSSTICRIAYSLTSARASWARVHDCIWRVRLADHFESNWNAKTLSPRTSSHRLLRDRRRLSPRRVCISQIARQSLPHRPTHLNWFEQSSITQPHSGQMQFTRQISRWQLTELSYPYTAPSMKRSASFWKRPVSAQHLGRARSLWIALGERIWIRSRFRGALLNHFLESRTSSCESSLYCSRWHPEEICRFANAQAIDVAQLEGCAQSRR